MILTGGHGRPPLAAIVAVALALVVAACLPSAIKPPPPTPTLPPPTPTAPPTPTPTPGPPTPTPGPSFTVYTVKRGDTLTSIARRFHTDGRSIAYWNRDTYPGLDPESASYRPDSIKRGWTLKVLPGRTYEPPADDGETGEQSTPTPDDSEDFEPLPSDGGGSGG